MAFSLPNLVTSCKGPRANLPPSLDASKDQMTLARLTESTRESKASVKMSLSQGQLVLLPCVCLAVCAVNFPWLLLGTETTVVKQWRTLAFHLKKKKKKSIKFFVTTRQGQQMPGRKLARRVIQICMSRNCETRLRELTFDVRHRCSNDNISFLHLFRHKQLFFSCFFFFYTGTMFDMFLNRQVQIKQYKLIYTEQEYTLQMFSSHLLNYI